MSRTIRPAMLVLMTLTAGLICGCGWTEIWDSVQTGALSAVQNAAADLVAGWLEAIGGILPV